MTFLKFIIVQPALTGSEPKEISLILNCSVSAAHRLLIHILDSSPKNELFFPFFPLLITAEN